MKFLQTSIILISILCLFSCKKDNVNVYNSLSVDTIYPLPYFPAYPGSYWKYLNTNGDTLLSKTESDYIKNIFSYGNPESGVFQTAPAYVPKWNGYGISHSSGINSFYVYGYSLVQDNSIEKILSLNPGEEWILIPPNKYFFKQINRRVISVNVILNVNGTIYTEVVQIEDYCQWGCDTPNYIVSEHYYAKDVGLIMEYGGYDTLKLVNYHINK